MRVEDTAVPSLLNVGLPIVGSALMSPFFETCGRDAGISIEELLASAPERRKAIIAEVLKHGRAAEPVANEAIWDA